MGKQTQRTSTGTCVRIWRQQKERLVEVVKAKAIKERRLVYEAELVSKAVDAFCDREEKKLGIKQQEA